MGYRGVLSVNRLVTGPFRGYEEIHSVQDYRQYSPLLYDSFPEQKTLMDTSRMSYKYRETNPKQKHPPTVIKIHLV